MPRKLTNKANMPEPLVRAMSYDGYVKDPTKISVTTLIDSPIVSILKDRFDYYEDVMDNVWNVFGSAIHTVFNKGAYFLAKDDAAAGIEPRYVSEERIEIELDGVKVTGTPDLWYKLHPEILYDYKNTSVWKVIRCKKDVDSETGQQILVAGKDNVLDWAKQLNIYRYLIYKKYGVVIKKIRVIALLKDWKSADSYQTDYPPAPICMVDIPVYPLEKMEQYLLKRLEIHRAANILADQDVTLVPTCNEEERWAKEDTWKIMSSSSASKSSKNFPIRSKDDEKAALDYLERTKQSNPSAYIKIVKGEDQRCNNYCPVKNHCHYYLSKFK